MNINAAFPSKYLRAADLPPNRPVPVTIASVQMEDVSGDSSELKPVLYFNGKDKGVVLNKTNGQVIAALYGPETDGWTGQPLILVHDPTVAMMGRVVGGLRVRAPEIGTVREPAPVPPADVAAALHPEQEHAPLTEDSIPF